MENLALLASLEARPGKEKDVEEFLKSVRLLVFAEAGTLHWYAFKTGPSTFGIFDTFNSEEGRNAHVSGDVAKALFARAEELFVKSPEIAKVDILASKSH